MHEMPEPKGGEGGIDTRVGAAVVLLATFMAICSVKAGNISQQMQRAQADRNDSWAWFQARNLREAVYESTAAELTAPRPNESTADRHTREALAAEYKEKAHAQEQKKDQQKEAAEKADAEYKALGAKDDQFDLCEAALAIGLAMMGVTALTRKGWLFWLALVPSVVGVAMGVAGFLGADTDTPALRWAINLLS